METIIARFKVQAGKEEEALKQAQQLAESVQAEEPGALAYLVHRPADDPSEIVFFEVYEDAAVLAAHGQTSHMAKMRASFGELFDVAQVKIERLERVGGFARPEAG